MTLIELIDHQAQRLDAAGVSFGQGTLTAFDEAAWLVLWQLGRPLDTPLDDPAHDPDSRAQDPVSPQEVDAANQLVTRRIQTRQPAAYLTREAWLQGVPFYVDERVIIPRSLIAEVLVSGSIDPWLSEQTRCVLDLCTGNGSLAVLAAMAWPEVRVVGTDLSTDALAVARINVDRHGLGDRVDLLESDGLAVCLHGPGGTPSPAPSAPGRAGAAHAAYPIRFDLMLCNPPYVNAQSMVALPPEFRAEPALALSGNAAGGQDGMDFIRKLLAEAPQCLSENGVLILEIGHERPHFEAAFPHLQPLWLSTSAGDDQVLLLTRSQLLSGRTPAQP
jgi:ribosomal protein L3 glutamine methyltransferase